MYSISDKKEQEFHIRNKKPSEISPISPQNSGYRITMGNNTL